jgi:YbbR domain-containing protein
MEKLLQSRPFYLVISLLFAILLFFNANSSNLKSRPNVATTEMYSEALHEVPIQIEYPKGKKYFVSGFDAYATVYLSSYNRVRLDAEKNEATRSFTVVADLTRAKEGTVEVPLRVQGMNPAVTATVDPTTISVTIERKVDKAYVVAGVVPKNQLLDGYKVESLEVIPSTVKVTTGESTSRQIDHLEAVLPKGVSLNQDYTGEVKVRAVDKSGQVLNVETSPSSVELSVHLKAPEKQVSVVPVQSGDVPNDILQYNYTLSHQTVTISGPQSELDKVDVIHLPVDISNITSKQVVDVSFNQTLYSVYPSSIKVTVEPVKKDIESSTKK